ncbi:YdcF family protein [Bacillus sp. SCS-153A]|uniref:YdcF family protein n=1 Tax=Rossellomorea sedimentorum TaxID=3115294 RepID=UPI003906D09D
MKRKPFLIICLAATLIFLTFSALFGVTFGIVFILANLLLASFLYYSRDGENSLWRHIHKALLIGYALFLLSFSAVQLLLLSEMGSAPPEDINTVVILGAGLKGEELSQTLETRLEAGVEYLRENPQIPVIVSGGQGEGEDIPESTAMARYLVTHGISPERITEENQSTTTYENLRNSKRILEEKGAENERILIITSDYHVFRAKLMGEKLGLECSGLGGESGFFIKINYMIREYFAVVKAAVIGGEAESR